MNINERELLGFINHQMVASEMDPSFIKICECFDNFILSSKENDEYKGYVFSLFFSHDSGIDEPSAKELRKIGDTILFSTQDRDDTILLFPNLGQILIHVENWLMFK